MPKQLLAAARSALDPKPPTRVGKFELLDELGKGSFGTVYRALDTELSREVAIKILRAGRLATAEDTERFLREARSAAQLKHPGLVSIFEAGRTEEGVCYLVEELVRGATLAARIQGGPLAPASAARLVAEVAEALAAHRSGMQVRLYSDYPWRFRKDGGPADDFERDALGRLRENPDTPVYQFEEYQGRPVLRYAIARRMRETCLGCHNQLPDSVKKDWKIGDVRGVVEIIRPLDRDAGRTRAGLRDTFLLVGVVGGSLVGLTVAFVVIRARRGAGGKVV